MGAGFIKPIAISYQVSAGQSLDEDFSREQSSVFSWLALLSFRPQRPA